MFRVRKKHTDEIVTVLDVYLDPIYAKTFFLIWENDNWRWRPSDNFVPPNYEEKSDGREQYS